MCQRERLSFKQRARPGGGWKCAPDNNGKVPCCHSANRPPAKPFPVLPHLGASDAAGELHTTPAGSDASDRPPPSKNSFSTAREESRARSRPGSERKERPPPHNAGSASVGWARLGSRLCA